MKWARAVPNRHPPNVATTIIEQVILLLKILLPSSQLPRDRRMTTWIVERAAGWVNGGWSASKFLHLDPSRPWILTSCLVAAWCFVSRWWELLLAPTPGDVCLVE